MSQPLKNIVEDVPLCTLLLMLRQKLWQDNNGMITLEDKELIRMMQNG